MSFHDAMNPNGGVDMEHVIEKPNPNILLSSASRAIGRVRGSWYV